MKCRRPASSLTILLISACCVLTSCAVSRRPPAAPAGEINWTAKTPRDVLAALRAEQDKITSLTAAFSLSADPPPQGQPANMQGAIFFSRGAAGPRVRIQCFGFFGRILFDMLLRDGSVQLYVPSRRTMYTGSADRTARKTVWDDVMSAMFFDITEAALPAEAALSFDGDMVILGLQGGELRLDRATGLIRQWRQAGAVTSYDRYTAPDPGLPPLPEHIEVRAIDGSQRAVFCLSQVSLNSVPDTVFDMSSYTPGAVRDFSEIEKQGRP